MKRFAEVSPDTIIVENRQRIDLGDIEPLARSIYSMGQLNPCTIDNENRLIAGERRLRAVQFIREHFDPDFLLQVQFFGTLSPLEQKIIELEENIKRKEMTWQEEVLANYNICMLFQELEGAKTNEELAEKLSSSPTSVRRCLLIAPYLLEGNEKIVQAGGLVAAEKIIERIRHRASASALDQLSEILLEDEKPQQEESAPSSESLPAEPIKPVSTPSTPDEAPILLQSFLDWAPSYSGPRFNFLHCDFPYGVGHHKSEQSGTSSWEAYEDTPEVYWALCQCLAENLNRIASASCHMMFWLSADIQMQMDTINFFESKTNFVALPRSLIWHKTDNKGVIPDARRGPRYITEHALVFHRGDRPVVRSVANCYGAPTTRVIHPSEKPEPMLSHFFRLFVDEFTEMLDPTCGGGSSLRAARRMKATRVLGLEMDPTYHEAASHEYLSAERKARLSEMS